MAAPSVPGNRVPASSGLSTSSSRQPLHTGSLQRVASGHSQSPIASEAGDGSGQVGVRGDYILTLERDYDVYFDKERPIWRAEASEDSDEDEDKRDPQADSSRGGDDDAFAHKSNLELMIELPRLIRRVLYNFVKNPWFDRVVLTLVVINSVVLALDTPDLDRTTALGQFVSVADVTFVILFTLECLVKILALGLMSHDDSYFRSPWNWLDFGIVIEGLISTFAGGDGSLSGLRAFRVLRPLKTVSRLEGLKVIVNALLASMPLLFNTMIVVSFYFLVFGIVGVQVWKGEFHNRCFFLSNGLLDESDPQLCSDDGNGDHLCQPGRFCGKWTSNPMNDVVSFDNVLWAFNTIFASITLEGWTAVMYFSSDTVGWWTVFYWVLLIVFGAFILMNLTLAVILTKFRESVEEQEAQKELQKEMAEREKRLEQMTREYYEAKRRDPRASIKDPATKKPGTLVGQGSGSSRTVGIPRPGSIAVHGADAEARLRAATSTGVLSRVALRDLIDEDVEELGAVPERHDHGGAAGVGTGAQARSSKGASGGDGGDDDDDEDAKAAALPMTSSGLYRSGKGGQPSRELSAMASAAAAAGAYMSSGDVLAGTRQREKPKLQVTSGGDFCEPDDEEESATLEVTRLDRCLEATYRGGLACVLCVRDGVILPAYRTVVRSTLAPASRLIFPLVTHPIFENFILLCIVANTVTLAWEYYGMSTDLKNGLNAANIVFTVIFAAELVLKFIGLGPRGYWAEVFNRFDALIVIASLVELGIGGEGGLAAFRTVRIARVLRIAKYLDSMRMIAEVVRQSLESFSYIALLLLLFCFIYSVLGMQLFGGIFPADNVPRNNFDDLFSAFVTVFQILAGEAWNEIMYEVIGATGQPLGALYFISWVILGQFILLNLFLAVLLDNFSAGDEDDDAEASDSETESDDDDDDDDDDDEDEDDEDLDDEGGDYDGALGFDSTEPRDMTERKPNWTPRDSIEDELGNASPRAPGHSAGTTSEKGGGDDDDDDDDITEDDRHVRVIDSRATDLFPTRASSRRLADTHTDSKRSNATSNLSDISEAESRRAVERVLAPSSRQARKRIAASHRRLSMAIDACTPSPAGGTGPTGAAGTKGLLPTPNSGFFGFSSRSASPAPDAAKPDAAAVTPSPPKHSPTPPPVVQGSLDGKATDSKSDSGKSLKRVPSAADRIANLITSSLFSSRNSDADKTAEERRLKKRRKLAVKMILRRFRGVWLKVDEARASLGSYAFKRPHHEAALMALLPPPRPGIVYGGAVLSASPRSRARAASALSQSASAVSSLTPADVATQELIRQRVQSTRRLGTHLPHEDSEEDSGFPTASPAAGMYDTRRRGSSGVDALGAAANIVTMGTTARDRIGLAMRKEADREKHRHSGAHSSDKRQNAGKTFVQQALERAHDEREGEAARRQHAGAQAWGVEPEQDTRSHEMEDRPAVTEAAAVPAGIDETASVARSLHALEEVDAAELEHRLAHALRRERQRILSAAQSKPPNHPPPASAPQAVAPAAAGAAAGAAAAGIGIAGDVAARRRAVLGVDGGASSSAQTDGEDGDQAAPASSSISRFQMPLVWDNETWGVGINPAAPSMADVDGIEPEERKRIMLANIVRMWRTKDSPIDRQRRREAAFAAAEAMGPIDQPALISPLEAIAYLPSDMADAARKDVDFSWETLKARALMMEATLDKADAAAVWRQQLQKRRITFVPRVLEAECRSRLLGQANEMEGVEFDDANDDGDASAPPSETPDDRRKKAAATASFNDWQGNHLCCFPRHGAISKACRNIVRDRPLCAARVCNRNLTMSFDSVILFLIILSSVLLAAEGPPSETPPVVGSTAFSVLEILFTVIFSVEIVLKTIAFGFAIAPGSYLREVWNVIDFVVVVSSILNLTLSATASDSIDLGFLRTLRLLRCLRPLRVISRNQGMRVVVTALLRSITDIGNVMVVLLLVWLMFAILGVQLFAGKLHSCNDPGFPAATSRFGVRGAGGAWEVEPCSPQFAFRDEESGQLTPRQWVASQPNFDSVFDAMLLLFITSSGEGWPSVMFACADAVGVDISPQQDANRAAVLFFIAFIVVGSFFFLNLFTGVIFDNFLRLKKEMDSSGILTEGQREWVRRARSLVSIKPERTVVAPHRVKQAIRRYVFDFTQHDMFQTTILVAIVLNVVTLAITYYGEPPELTAVLDVFNYFFTALFIAEAILKSFALSFNQYMMYPWNRFDLVVVIGSVLDVIFSNVQGFPLGSLLGKIFRIARVLRVLRLAKAITGLRRLIVTLISSIPALVNVGSLLLLLFLIYAIMGVQSFGRIGDADSIGVHANFRTFGVALLTLFRISTGEGWEGFLFDTTNSGHVVAWLYFVSFVTIASFVMVNLFITIIIEEFETAEAETDGMSDSHLQAFKMVWKYFDPEGSSRIRVKDLEHFLRHLPEPMGIPIDSSAASGASLAALLRKLQEMDLDSHAIAGSSEQWVFFHEVLAAVHRTSFKARVPGKVMQDLHIHPVNVKRAVEDTAIRQSAASALQQDQPKGGGCCGSLRVGFRLMASGDDKAALESLSGGDKMTLPVSKIMATVAIRQAFQDRIARSRRRAALRRKREERRRGHLASIAEEADALGVTGTAAASAAAAAAGIGIAATAAEDGMGRLLSGQTAEESRRLRLDLHEDDLDSMPASHLLVLASRLGERIPPGISEYELRETLRRSITTAPGERTPADTSVASSPHQQRPPARAPRLSAAAMAASESISAAQPSHPIASRSATPPSPPQRKQRASTGTAGVPLSPPPPPPAPVRDTSPQPQNPKADASPSPSPSPSPAEAPVDGPYSARHRPPPVATGVETDGHSQHDVAPEPVAPEPAPVSASPSAANTGSPASSTGSPASSLQRSAVSTHALNILAKHRATASSPGKARSAFAGAALRVTMTNRAAASAAAAPAGSPNRLESVLERLRVSNPRFRDILDRQGVSPASGSPPRDTDSDTGAASSK